MRQIDDDWWLITTNDEFKQFADLLFDGCDYGVTPATDIVYPVLVRRAPGSAHTAIVMSLAVATAFVTAVSATAGKAVPQSTTQDDFNRHFSASLLTVVSLLVQNKHIDPVGYERGLAANLSVVDRWAADDKARAGIKQAVESVAAVLAPVYGDSTDQTKT